MELSLYLPKKYFFDPGDKKTVGLASGVFQLGGWKHPFSGTHGLVPLRLQ
jgi:hypothetical protein